MNWFERHLNWTAIIITFGGSLFTCLMVLFAQGFNLVFRPYLLAFEFKVYLAITVFFATLVSIICMTWITKKKHRHLSLILLFIPSGLFSLMFIYILHPPLLHHTFTFTEYDISNFYGIVYLVFLVSAGLWIIGLIIILFLKNRQEKLQFQNEGATLESLVENNESEKVVSIRRMGNSGFIRIFGVLLIIPIVIAGYSCFRMNFGYQVFVHESFNLYENEDLHYSEFMFECPKSYYRSWASGVIGYLGEEVALDGNQIKPFTVESTYIRINVSPKVRYEDNPTYPSLIEQCIYYYFKSTYGWNKLDVEIRNPTITQTVIDGIPAEYATFLTFYPNADYYYPWDEVKVVCFEREGIIWTISMYKWKDKTINPDPDFEHLLQTFKIIK